MTTFIAEIEDPEPRQALSLLRKRVQAVRCGGEQIGVASGFHLAVQGDRFVLRCRIELDDAKHEPLKHDLAAETVKMFVGEREVLAAVAP